GMGLQCDPTVIYALLLAGRWDGNLRRDDLMFDSPYNTYRYPGLPPGPIASPGKASLEAAARPASGDYVYFVSRNATELSGTPPRAHPPARKGAVGGGRQPRQRRLRVLRQPQRRLARVRA